MGWGKPEPEQIDEYETVNIDGATLYIHHRIKKFTNARIDLVTGGVGTKLILLGVAEIK
ncbi:hypothetical protein [uncultured Desulfuromusa sp.]|uniref:hypothetical protein n=1 Tax=uncultured Desulfuromusa sp. TaxID=219183 RepID=UPI002AA90817|nr:hypothetical protein [uncultured Desulfuromusa sp.]